MLARRSTCFRFNPLSIQFNPQHSNANSDGWVFLDSSVRSWLPRIPVPNKLPLFVVIKLVKNFNLCSTETGKVVDFIKLAILPCYLLIYCRFYSILVKISTEKQREYRTKTKHSQCTHRSFKCFELTNTSEGTVVSVCVRARALITGERAPRKVDLQQRLTVWNSKI